MGCDTRSVVSGRYVNAHARNDWVLKYLFRASSGDVGTVAGLRPVENVPGLENVDVADKISGHMSYRRFMPLIIDQLGFPFFADYFNDPVEPDLEERVAWREEKSAGAAAVNVEAAERDVQVSNAVNDTDDGDRNIGGRRATTAIGFAAIGAEAGESKVPIHADFHFAAIIPVLGKAELNSEELKVPEPNPFEPPHISPPRNRSVAALLPISEAEPPSTPSFSRLLSVNDAPARGCDSGTDDTETEDATPPPPPYASYYPSPSTASNVLRRNCMRWNASTSVELSFAGADGAITHRLPR
ncbi:hypothetical protein MKEN_00389000 [Mycena kentingensis (nom. inval.)]|nr:hypothetical protein MKEN_00389000 [Mycena kentingensis (nom. inval.)]